MFRGLLPGQADSVTLHLVTTLLPRYDGQPLTIQGSYYGPDGHPYQLSGGSGTGAADSVVLDDNSLEHRAAASGEGPAWRLRRQADGSLAGTVGGRAARLRPVAAPAGGLSFAVRCFADSLAALPKQARSPQASFLCKPWRRWVGRWPCGRRCRRALGRSCAATRSAPYPLALPALFAQQRDAFFKDYRQDVAGMESPHRYGRPGFVPRQPQL
ncbi:MAG: hypothetical protein WKG07_44390 [Hymenobacter sp.]